MLLDSLKSNVDEIIHLEQNGWIRIQEGEIVCVSSKDTLQTVYTHKTEFSLISQLML